MAENNDPLGMSPMEMYRRTADYDKRIVELLEQKLGGATTEGIWNLDRNIETIDRKLKIGEALDKNETLLVRFAITMFAGSAASSVWRHTKKSFKPNTDQETKP